MSLIDTAGARQAFSFHAMLVTLLGMAFSLTCSGCAQLSSNNANGASTASAQPGGGTGAKTAGNSHVYAVTFGVKNNAGHLGAVQFTARPKDGGTWQGEGANVACRSVAGSAMHACNEKSGSELSCGFIDTNGIATPGDLVTCSFESSKSISGGDFSIKVIDATNTATKPVKADVEVTRVNGK